MGTRAYIAYEKDDGTYSAIYSHWDGKPENILPEFAKLNRKEIIASIDQADRYYSCWPNDIGRVAGDQPAEIFNSIEEIPEENYTYILRKDGKIVVKYYSLVNEIVPHHARREETLPLI
jgi:hypothetical protein